jgi:hypothetical protein
MSPSHASPARPDLQVYLGHADEYRGRGGLLTVFRIHEPARLGLGLSKFACGCSRMRGVHPSALVHLIAPNLDDLDMLASAPSSASHGMRETPIPHHGHLPSQKVPHVSFTRLQAPYPAVNIFNSIK